MSRPRIQLQLIDTSGKSYLESNLGSSDVLQNAADLVGYGWKLLSDPAVQWPQAHFAPMIMPLCDASTTGYRHHIATHRFRDEGARALGPHLTSLSYLPPLDVSWNHIGAEGVRALGPHLANLSSLKHISLQENGVSAEGAKALGPHLAHFSSLQHRNLEDNSIPAEGLTAPQYSQLPKLTSLRLLSPGSDIV